jgi:hypothetical protein
VSEDELLPALTRSPLPQGFARRTIRLAPGEDMQFAPTWWRGTLVVIRTGCLEVTWSSGSSQRFDDGDVLWLDGLPVRLLGNPGRTETLLIGLRRTSPNTTTLRSARRPLEHDP